MTYSKSRIFLFFLGISFIFCTNLFALDQWLEAENHPSKPIKFANDKNAGNGKITWGTRWYRLAQVPLPMNRQAVYVYINAKTTDSKNQYFILRIGKKNYGKAYLPASNKWCWTKLGPVRYDGNSVMISTNGAAGIKSYLDGFVLSTSDKLNTHQLEKIKNTVHNGQLAIGQTPKPPLIDGKLNDLCWLKAVNITPFIIKRSTNFAKDQTQAYLSYDKDNIYVAFKCYAKVLDPVENRLHEFVNKVKENDSKSIYKDDCATVLLAPDSELCYEFTVNANGALSDAKCKAPDYWGTRDLKWNSGAKTAGTCENGFWSAEIAIPRSALNNKNTASTWKFLVGRINQSLKETSAFSAMQTGFHDEHSLSTLFFRGSVPAIGLNKLPALNAGDNNLLVNINRRSAGTLIIEQIIQSDKKIPENFTQSFSLLKSKTVKAPLKITGGNLKYQIALRDGNTFGPFLQTPEYSFNPAVLGLKYKIQAPQKYDFFVNGKANRSKLNTGINLLALKADKGTRAEFSIGKETLMLDASWKFSANLDTNWNTQNCNVSSWKRAPVKDGVLQQSGYLRKIIIINETELWPNWSQYGVNICRGSLQQFFFPPRGLKGIKNAVDFKMNIELPLGFELPGASSYYKSFEASSKKIGIVKRNGIEYNKYQISLPHNKKYLQKLPLPHQYCVFAVRAPLVRETDADMYYYASADGSYIEEIPQKLKINLLPELSGKQPKNIIFQLWIGSLGRMSDLGLRQKIAHDLKSAGFTEIQKVHTETPGMKDFTLISLGSWSFSFVPFIKEHPDMALVDDKGKKSTKFACPSVLLNDPVGRKYFEKAVVKFLETMKVNDVVWDYEHSPFSSDLACYCPRCMKAFGNGTLSPARIKAVYREKWIDFMTGRMAEMAGRMSDILHKVNPQIVFSIYSGYQTERCKSHYGVDWSKLNGKIDLALMGYGRSQVILDASYKAIGKTKLVLGAIARPYRNTERSYPTDCSAAMLMRRLLDSKGGGVLVYCLNSLDGRTLHAMSRVSALAAEYEDFFIKGRRADAAVKCTGEYAVLQWNKQKLVLAINQSNKTRKFTVVLPGTKNIFDFYAKKQLPASKYISGSILPGDIKAYIIK